MCPQRSQTKPPLPQVLLLKNWLQRLYVWAGFLLPWQNTTTKFSLQKHWIGLPASEAQRPDGRTKAWQQEQPRAHKQETERAPWEWSESFETSKLFPSDTPPPRPHCPILPKQVNQLGTKYSNMGTFSFTCWLPSSKVLALCSTWPRIRPALREKLETSPGYNQNVSPSRYRLNKSKEMCLFEK